MARVIAALGALNLDHLGTHVGQHLPAPGACQYARDVEYLDACQGLCDCAHRVPR